jgi:hypothetical protein
VDFRLTAKPSGRGIRTADLRVFELDGLGFNAFMQHAKPADADGRSTAGPRDERDWWRMRRDFDNAVGKRRGVSPGELEEVSRVCTAHVGGRPTEAVEAMGNSRRTAARRIGQARGAGLMPPTTPGKRKA